MKEIPPKARHVLSVAVAVLRAILLRSTENSMNGMIRCKLIMSNFHHIARNLAICIGQSLIWPVKAEDVLKNDVPPFVEVRSHVSSFSHSQHFSLYSATQAHC